ncbi:MAG: NAD-dependent epimerase/dehydratase family protein [Phycisphaerae bacterium]
MNILVCGNSGFIGTHLTRLLAERGHSVSGMDLLSPKDDEPLAEHFIGDIRKADDCRRALGGGTECVINLAAKHHDFGITRQEYFETNEGGTRALLEAMAETGVGKFLFYSSVAVYGARDEESDEDTPPTPTSDYGASKLAAEAVIREWVEQAADRSAVIFRPCLIFGEGNFANMYSLIRQIDRGRFFHFGPKDTIKAVAYVGNIIRATAQWVERMPAGVTIHNYVDKPDLTVDEMVTVISDALGRKRPKKRFPLWLGVAAGKMFDLASKVTGKPLRVSSARVKKLATSTRFAADRIRQAGFEPEFSIEQGLRSMTAWYLRQKELHGGKEPPEAKLGGSSQ